METYGQRSLNWYEQMAANLGFDLTPERVGNDAVRVPDPDRRWTEEDGIIRFTLVSDGTHGYRWIERLEKTGHKVTEFAKWILRSRSGFRRTVRGTVHDVVVLKGSLFDDDERTIGAFRAEAARRGLEPLHPEVACLIRSTFTDDDLAAMGLSWLVVDHGGIALGQNGPRLMGAFTDGGGKCVSAVRDRPEQWWRRDTAMAFSAPRT